MRTWCFVYLLFFLFVINNTGLVCKGIFEKSSVDLSLLSDSDNSFMLLDSVLPEKFFLERLSIKTDIDETAFINKKEITDILGMNSESYLSLQDIKKGLFYLKQKNKFDSIIFAVTKTTLGYAIDLYLTTQWVFYKLYIKGSILGKDKYKNYYLLNAGDPFDLAKHQHSLLNIEKKLAHAGYLNAHIKDTLDYDKATKTIKVTLYFEDIKSFTIDKVNINMHHSVSLHDKIQTLCNDLKGAYYTHGLITSKTQELKSYLNNKGYLDHEVSINVKRSDDYPWRVNLEVIVLLPHRKKFKFFGNTFFNSHDLQEQLLTVGDSALFIPPELFAEDIIELYKSKGFLNVQVEWQEQEDRFFFMIKEGSRATIKEINIAFNLPNQELLKVVESYYAKAFDSNYYDKDILKKTHHAIVQYCVQQGYKDFFLDQEQIIPLSSSSHDYRLELSFNSGEYSEANKTQERSLSTLLHASLNSCNTQNKDTTLRFGKTIIKGSYILDTAIVLRELAYQEGDIYDPQKIEVSLAKIKSLGIFETVTLKPALEENNTEHCPMILYLVQDDPFEVRTRLGIERTSKAFTGLGGFNYKFGGSFLWKNPFNNGDLLHIDIDLTRYKRNISAAYDVPWIKNYPLWASFKVYNALYEQPYFIGSRDILYKVSQTGGNIAMRSPFYGGETSVILGAQSQKLMGSLPNLSSIINYNPELINRQNPYIFSDCSWIYSAADDPFNPIRAFTSFLSLKGALSLEFSKSSYLKVLYEQTHVFPLHNSIVGAFRFRIGHIFGGELHNIVPSERFYLGGPTTIRSYEPLGVPPLNNFCSCFDKSHWTPLGSRSMININAELRFPLYKALSGVVFNDMGALSNTSLADIKAHEIFGGTGFGLRYLTPLGPVRFDIAWKWSKRAPDDKSYAWYLTFGHAF